MSRLVITLLLAVLLAAVLIHPDAAAEGKEQAPARPEGFVPSNDKCGACEEKRLHLTQARSPVNKVFGVAENVCKQVAKDVLLVFQDGKGCCNSWKSIIQSAWLEVMKDDNDIVNFISEEKPSIKDLKDYVCNKSPRSAEEDKNGYQSIWVTRIKNIGSYVKEIKNVGRNILKLFQTEKPTNRAIACYKLSYSLE